MKKLFAIVLVLALCLSVMAIGTSAATIQYVTVTGTMNGWNPASEADRMEPTPTMGYVITYENMPAGSYEFKFTANGNWSDLDLGGAFMGSGVWAPLSWGGSNICFTLEEAADVTIVLDLEGYRFQLQIGNRVDEVPEDMQLHITVPETWGATYVYVWGPELLGTWPGTQTTSGDLAVTPAFDGMVISNGAGTQSWDITDIDKTQPEVWITVNNDGSYSLSYEAPNDNPPALLEPIYVHVIVPESWENAYVYTYNPEQVGSWPGTLVLGDVIGVTPNFEGLIINNGAGAQTADIKDIDLTASDVWVVVAEDCSYALFYNEADVVIPTPASDIRIHVTAEHWNAVYAYTYNPASCGSWPGVLVDGSFVVPATFEGLVLNNGEGQQTADIKDIDLTAEEVWITVNADNSYTLSYTPPVVENPEGPVTGDGILSVMMVMAMASLGILTLTKKREY